MEHKIQYIFDSKKFDIVLVFKCPFDGCEYYEHVLLEDTIYDGYPLCRNHISCKMNLVKYILKSTGPLEESYVLNTLNGESLSFFKKKKSLNKTLSFIW